MDSLNNLLRCPQTRQPLREGTPEELKRFQEKSDQPDTEAILVREDGKVAYPYTNGFPDLLPDGAVEI